MAKDILKEKYVNVPPGEIELSQNYYYNVMKLETDLLSKYKEYDKMDEEVIEVTSALDIYADNAVAGGNNLETEFQVVLSKENAKAQKVLDDLAKTELKDIIWSIARNTLKYGNWFVEIVPKGTSVVRFKELPVDEMRVNKDEFGRVKNIVQKPTGTVGPGQTTFGAGNKDIVIDIWKCVHFSMNRPYTYGTSVLSRLRRISRQLRLCEDALVIARLTKAGQKVVYKIDVTGMNTAEALAYIKKWKASMRKKRIMNPLTGEVINDFNPLRDEEDIFLPVRQNSATDVTPLEGDANIADIADINFLQNRLFAGLKIPKAYLGFEADTHNRNVITALDIQFARQVRRLQKVLEKGLRHIYDIAFILAGLNPEDIDYKVTFPVISTIDALTEWQVNQTKLMTAQLMLGMGISLPDEWILGTLLNLPKSQVEAIVKYTKQQEKEQKAEEARQAALGQVQQNQANGAQPPAEAPQQPFPVEQSASLTPDDISRLNMETPTNENMSSEDIARLNMEAHSVSLLRELVNSNQQLKSIMEDTQMLISWKMDWANAQQRIEAMNKKFGRE